MDAYIGALSGSGWSLGDVWGFGFWVSGVRVWGFGFGALLFEVLSLGFRVWGLGFWVWASGFRVCTRFRAAGVDLPGQG